MHNIIQIEHGFFPILTSYNLLRVFNFNSHKHKFPENVYNVRKICLEV